MFRIDNSTAGTILPTPTPAGSPGFFTTGSIGGELATIVSADFMNQVQEELIAVLAAAAIAPDKTNNAQVITAILALIRDTLPPPAHTFIAVSSTTFIVPAKVTSMEIECWGGGGGGGAGNGSTLGGSGGGGGAYALGYFSVTPGATLTITIGAGGAGSAAAGNAGLLGGTTSVAESGVGTLITAAGGGGGPTAGGNGGSGGNSGSGYARLIPGGGGYVSAAFGAEGAPGGGSPLGGYGGQPGNNGGAPGGGGCGNDAINATTGGSAGGPGQVVLTYVLPP
jgi:hypothetical protein